MAEAMSLLSQQRSVYRQDNQLVVTFSDLDKELLIKSNNGEIEIQQRQKFLGIQDNINQPVNIIAIYGIIPLKKINYLIVITQASQVGQIMDLPIFQADKFIFIPIENERINSDDKSYINGLNEIFQTKTFYFSEKYDLTNSLQRYIENKGIRKPLQQYWINYEYVKVFRLCNPELWIPIFISGLVVIRYCKINQIDCQICLISRRDQRRMGRRFISRGADLDGNCSNFAETEQIFKYQNYYFSFLQCRGSMPFKWIQKPNLKWSPKAKILGDIGNNKEIAQKHFQDQFQLGIQKHILVNLIDKKGTQKMLGEYYNQVIQQVNNSNLRLIWFDFHHECRGMKYENISKLIQNMAEDLKLGDQFSFELKNGTSQLNIIGIITLQKSIVRTNCVDCLDRTNVVQSVIARHQLWNILPKIGISRQTNQAMENFPHELEVIFRDIWTLNADTVSLLYTGTGALKTDSTKKGKRTMMGALVDGQRSITRYFIGNFSDGGIQNNIDLLTNKLDLKKQSYKNRYFSGCHMLLIIFTTVGLGLSKMSEYAISHPKALQVLRVSQQKKQEKESYTSLVAYYAIIITGMFIIRTLLFSKYKLFVRDSKLNH